MNTNSVQKDRQGPKIIYVMGAGRSGSTILGVVLGNCANVFYAGELDAWLRRSGIPTSGGDEQTRFWNIVREEVGGEDLFGDEAWRCLEHSQVLFRIRYWSARRRLRKRYLEVAKSLYDRIADNAGVTHIVDTAHYPLRAKELRRLAGLDVYLVYLVRNPHSVVASFNRRDTPKSSKPPVTTNAYLWLTHFLSVIVFLGHRRDRRFVLHYEDFVAAPVSMLRQILDDLDISAPLPDLTSLGTGMPFQGNRLLKSQVIKLRSETDPLPQKSGITTLVQLPWTVVLSRLRPTITSSLSDERVSVSESR